MAPPFRAARKYQFYSDRSLGSRHGSRSLIIQFFIVWLEFLSLKEYECLLRVVFSFWAGRVSLLIISLFIPVHLHASNFSPFFLYSSFSSSHLSTRPHLTLSPERVSTTDWQNGSNHLTLFTYLNGWTERVSRTGQLISRSLFNVSGWTERVNRTVRTSPNMCALEMLWDLIPCLSFHCTNPRRRDKLHSCTLKSGALNWQRRLIKAPRSN